MAQAITGAAIAPLSLELRNGRKMVSTMVGAAC